MTSARLTLTSVALTAALACSVPPMTAPMNDAGPASDANVDDGGTGFDPSMTYPGEGEPCEFSLFCPELQICVDGECARHERFEEGDLVFGAPVRIPHEMLRASTLYTEATVDWDTMSLLLFGELLPGRSGPRLAFFAYDGAACQVALYGDGPPRVVHVPELSCSTVGISPDGHVLLAGMQPRGADEQPRWALLSPDGQLLAEGGYPREFLRQVQEAAGDPEIRLFSMTSILWHEGGFLFSASAGVPTTRTRDMLLIGGPKTPTHTFFGKLTLDGSMRLQEIAGTLVHEGSFGWIVRDERGLHSILTVFNMPLNPTESAIEALSWETGEREELARGSAGQSAGSSRYFQPYADEWGLTTLQVRSRCSEELFENIEHVRSIWWSPEDECPDVPVGTIQHENLLGSSAIFGAAYTGHPILSWLAIDFQEAEATRVLQTADGRVLMNFDDATPPVDDALFLQAIGRFARTMEVFAVARNEGAEENRLSYWELPLSQRME